MIWCRKVRRKIAAFKCETCSDAVKVNRQYLCGRAFDAPVEQEVESKKASTPQQGSRRRSGSRSGRRRRPQGVRMREKASRNENK